MDGDGMTVLWDGLGLR